MSLDKEPTLLITETYKSIQGESTWAGLPCYFIRLTGCPLRCRWCDSEYAFHGGTRIPISELVRGAVESQIPLVEVTGGEPLAQPNCPLLCEKLLEAGLTVLIETAGSHPILALPPGVIRILDLKCPDSGECDRNLWSNLEVLQPEDEIKFVLASRRDFEWARDRVREFHLEKKVSAVLFSTVFGELDPRSVVEWILEENLPVRFQLQAHKFIWEPNRTGV
jgi:7-carboxy-7-deazaguanine synthase